MPKHIQGDLGITVEVGGPDARSTVSAKVPRQVWQADVGNRVIDCGPHLLPVLPNPRTHLL